MPPLRSLVDSSTEARESILNSRPSPEQIYRRGDFFNNERGPSLKMDALQIGSFIGAILVLLSLVGCTICWQKRKSRREEE
ncbi:unnamed protein product [Fusarium langsethiae]|nr:unnamed protein product [Fusarium langsethiae]